MEDGADLDLLEDDAKRQSMYADFTAIEDLPHSEAVPPLTDANFVSVEVESALPRVAPPAPARFAPAMPSSPSKTRVAPAPMPPEAKEGPPGVVVEHSEAKSDTPPAVTEDPLTDATQWPALSDMTTVRLVERYNALLPLSFSPTVATECGLLKRLALSVVGILPPAPTADDMQAVVALAALADLGVVLAVLNALSDHVGRQVAIDSETIMALAAALRLAVNTASKSSTFQPRENRGTRALAAAVLNTATGLAAEAGLGAAVGAVPLPDSDVVGAGVDAATGAALDAVPDVAGYGREEELPAGDDDAHQRNIVAAVVRTVDAALDKIVGSLEDVNVRSDSRDTLLHGLCRLLDAVVDVMPRGDGPEGMGAPWRAALVARLDGLLPGTANGQDMYAQHCLLYAKQAVLHIRQDLDAEVAALLQPSADIVSGVLQLGSAVLSKDIAGVFSALRGLKTTAGDFMAKQPKQWYNTVRLLRDMPLQGLLAAVKDKEQPPHVTFFVVELLDAVARRPTTGGAYEASEQHAAVLALVDVYTEATALEADTAGERLRGHILHRLHRLCRCPDGDAASAARHALKSLFSYTEPLPVWRRVLPCVGSTPVPVAVKLQADLNIFLSSVDAVPAYAPFYDEFNVGVGPLYTGRLAPEGTLQAALEAVDAVEAAVEQLRANAAARAAAEGMAEDLALYVKPLCSPTKDVGDDSEDVKDLDATVVAWTAAAGEGCRVLLLHGHSGSGKSLYVHLLEQQLWAAYRRGGTDAVVPLLVRLPSVKDAAKSAVEEVLLERCGLPVRAMSSRRWVLLLDGYDEVAGGQNFVVGNRLPTLLPRSRVVITCRTEFLEAKGAHRELFTAGDVTKVPHDRLVELYVRPLKPDAVDTFFRQWAALHAGWPASKYLAFIRDTPGLQELARTPFVLRAMADALPLLDAEPRRRVTRAEVYAAFTTKWWSSSKAKLAASPPAGLPAEFDAVASYDNFSQDLAVTMLARGQLAAESSAGVFTIGGASSSPWARFFKANSPVTTATRQGCPIRPSGRMWSFVHKSLAEFHAARCLWADVEAVADAGALPAFPLSALSAFPLGAQPAVLSFMVDMLLVAVSPGLDARRPIVAALDCVVRRCPNATASSNAASVLAQAGVSLAGVDWGGASLPGAILSDARLLGANLAGADLSGAALARSNLEHADLRGASLSNARLGQHPMLEGHTGAVHWLAFSHGTLASAGEDAVHLWDAAGSCCAVLPVEGALRVAFTADGATVVTGGRGVQVWDTATRECKATVDGVTLRCMDVAPGGHWLAAGSAEGAVTLVDLGTGSTAALGSHVAGVQDVAVSPGGDLFATCCDDDDVKLWSAVGREALGSLPQQYPVCLDFSPNGEVLLVGSLGSPLGVWDPRSRACLRTIGAEHQVARCVGFASDGAQFALAAGATVSVWDFTTGTATHLLNAHTDSVSCVCFGAHDDTLASTSATEAACTVRLWDLHSQTSQARHPGHSGFVWSVTASPAGDTLVTGGSDRTVRVWDVATAAPVQVLTGHTGEVYGCAFSPDGRLLASGSDDNTVRVWGKSGGEWGGLRTCRGHSDMVNDVCFSGDGHLMASASDDNTVRVWRVGSWDCVHTLGLGGCVASVAFAPGAPRGAPLLAAATSSSVKVWNVAAERCVGEKDCTTAVINALCYSPDGSLLALGNRTGSVCVLSAATLAEVEAFEFGGASMCVAFNPAGSELACSTAKAVLLWGLQSSPSLQTASLGSRDEAVFDMCWITDDMLASTTGDSARLWRRQGAQWHCVSLLGLPKQLSATGALISGVEASGAAVYQVLEQHGAVHGSPLAAGGPEGGSLASPRGDGADATQVAALRAEVAQATSALRTELQSVAGGLQAQLAGITGMLKRLE